jgi:hypothetical protein
MNKYLALSLLITVPFYGAHKQRSSRKLVVDVPTQSEVEESPSSSTPPLSPLSDEPGAQSLTTLEERAARQSQKCKRRCCFGCK